MQRSRRCLLCYTNKHDGWQSVLETGNQLGLLQQCSCAAAPHKVPAGWQQQLHTTNCILKQQQHLRWVTMHLLNGMPAFNCGFYLLKQLVMPHHPSLTHTTHYLHILQLFASCTQQLTTCSQPHLSRTYATALPQPCLTLPCSFLISPAFSPFFTPTAGVLALQGSFREHMALLAQIPGVAVAEVRTKEELAGVAGLIIPGGLPVGWQRMAAGSAVQCYLLVVRKGFTRSSGLISPSVLPTAWLCAAADAAGC